MLFRSKAQRPTRSPDATQQEYDRAKKELDAVRRRLEETHKMRDAASRHKSAIEKEASEHAGDVVMVTQLEQQLADYSREAETLNESNLREQERQEKRKREIAGTPRSGTELVFNPPADSDRRAWLVELSGDGVTVLLLGGGRTEKLGRDSEAGTAFDRWLSELSTDGDYCLLLVRPSASDDVEQGVQQRLNDAGIRFGIDLIGEDQTVRDGSQTTAPESGREG